MTHVNQFNAIGKGNIYEKGVWRPLSTTYARTDVDDGLTRLENVVALGLDKALVYSALKSLESKGNEEAYNLMHGKIGIFDMEDLQQEILTVLATYNNPSEYEFIPPWSIATDEDGKHYIHFENEDVRKACYGAVSSFMYSFAHRHYKKAYVSIDNEDVRIDDIKALSMHIDFDSVIFNDDMIAFMSGLTDIECDFIRLRLQGVSVVKCADIIGVSRQHMRTVEKHVRKAWTAYNSEK